MLYQNTPKASTGNAFAWLTWKSEVEPMTPQEASAERIKAKKLTPGLSEPENHYEKSGKKRRPVVIAPRDPWAAMKVGRLTKARI